MLKIYKNILVIFFFVLVGACTNSPRNVTASIPLVSISQDKPNKKEIPSQYWTFLSNSKQTSFAHDKYQVQLTALYTSALGQVCRELILVDNKRNEERRTACEVPFVNENNQQVKAWFLEKEIIESRVYVEL